MEESVVTFSTRDTKKGKKLTLLSKRRTSDEYTASSSDSCRPNSRSNSRSGWRNFFNIFTKNSLEKLSQRKSTHIQQTEQGGNGVYLDEIDDDFAMAISMPCDMEGRDVQITIELKAIERKDVSSDESAEGLEMTKETPSKSTFSGNVKIPCDTTIEQISRMPLYFINPNQVQRPDGSFSNKIETIIKPLEDNLPENVDKKKIISELNLKLDLQSSRKSKKLGDSCSKTLTYTFLSNKKLSLLNIKPSITDDELNSNKEEYDESSKSIVDDILSEVVSKVQKSADMATQYSHVITSVNKEVDVQKSFLFKKTDMQKIYEKRLKKFMSSEESLYPNSSTTTTHESSPIPSGSFNSMYYLKAPTNTPTIAQPKYVIKYDTKLKVSDRKLPRPNELFVKVLHSPKKEEPKPVVMPKQSSYERRKDRSKLDEKTLKADIDKTLDLLECAKNQLLTYIDPKNYEERTRNQQYEGEKVRHVSPPITVRMVATKQSDKTYDEQFFREGPREDKPDLILFSKEDKMEPVTINILQDIYEPTTEEREISEALLKERYSGENETSDLSSAIVENDINIMIKDLIDASKDIKHLVLKSLNPQYTREDGSPVKKKFTDHSILKDVQNLLDLLLDKTEEQVPDPPVETEGQIKQINCCSIDDQTYDEPVKLTKNIKSEDLGRPQPTITVKRGQSFKTSLKNDDTLVERLERDAHFLAEIYHEVCTSESRIPSLQFLDESWKRVENIISQQVNNNALDDGTTVPCGTEDETPSDQIPPSPTVSADLHTTADCSSIAFELNEDSSSKFHSTSSKFNSKEQTADSVIELFSEDSPRQIFDPDEITLNLSVSRMPPSPKYETPSQMYYANTQMSSTSDCTNLVMNVYHEKIEETMIMHKVQNRAQSFACFECSAELDVDSEGLRPATAPSSTLPTTSLSESQMRNLKLNLSTPKFKNKKSKPVINAKNEPPIKIPPVKEENVRCNPLTPDSGKQSNSPAIQSSQAFVVAEQSTSQHSPSISPKKSVVFNVKECSRNYDLPESSQEFVVQDLFNPTDETLSEHSYLKHAARVEDKPHFSSDSLKFSSEEVLNEVFIQPLVEENTSHYSHASNKARTPFDIVASSSSSVISVTTTSTKHKPKITAKLSNLTNKTNKLSCSSSISSRQYSPSIRESDYDADKEEYPVVLPHFKHEYISQQELNDTKEIKYIEENVEANTKLNASEEESTVKLRKKKMSPPIVESMESLVTSLSLESEGSCLEMSLNEPHLRNARFRRKDNLTEHKM